MAEYYMGLLSGTSMDAIDAAIFDFSVHPPQLKASLATPITPDLKHQLQELCSPGPDEINRLGNLDVQLGKLFATAAEELLNKASLSASDIQAIGSHGQTIRHCPDTTTPFTLQIGDPNIIAAQTGITTVADFRRKDMALGGQGAPLAPAFHEFLLRQTHTDRFVVNIGGIANISYLPRDINKSIIGFDTGPGNTLMDAWAKKHINKEMDKDGKWANSGTICETLLAQLLADPYFTKPFPKSTGPEYFNLSWLEQFYSDKPANNIQRTLLELTAASISQDIQQLANEGTVYVCGGGANNNALVKTIKQRLPNFTVQTSDQAGIPGDWLEAMLFAWLAKCRLNNLPINLSKVTGAKGNTCLGGIYA